MLAEILNKHPIQWNYTTVLNIIFLLLAAALLVRFFRSGAGPMLKMMGGSPAADDQHGHPEGVPGLPGPLSGTRRWGRLRAAAPGSRR